jgi:hypothetical protein
MPQIRNRYLGTPDYRDVMNSPQNIPSQGAISQRAREIWESSGQIDGHDLENWLQAEKELLEAASTDSSNDNDPEKVASNQPRSSAIPETAPSTAWKRDPVARGRDPDVGKQTRAKR